MTYRVNGRATQAEEHFLRNAHLAEVKSAKYPTNDNMVSARAKYKELKAIFDDYGWPAFDKDQIKLFDTLNAAYGPKKEIEQEKAAREEQRNHLDEWGDSDRTESARYQLSILGASVVTPLGDGFSKVKVRYQPFSFWRDVSSDDYGPFLADTGGLAAPSTYRAINDEYNITCPESETPDSKLIPDSWTPPKKDSTKHADIPDEIKAVLLARYRALRDSNELFQTNFYYGDNDNTPKKNDESGEYEPLVVACDWEERPSITEITKALAGVKWDTRPAFTDTLGNERPETVVPFEVDVSREPDSRTVSERKRDAAFAERIEDMSAEQKVWHAENNNPTYTPPIRKWGKLRFVTSDFDEDIRGSKRRGELLTVESDNGVEYRGRDTARKSKIFFTKEQREQIKKSAACRYANLCRDNGVNADDVSASHVEQLSKPDRAKQLANKAKQTKRWYDRQPALKPDPAFFTVSMTVDRAREIHHVTPANDNRVYSGLPWKLWRPDYLPTSGAGSPLLSDSPEEFFIENHSRKTILAVESELSADEVLVMDLFMSSESFAVLGSKTGDEGKHERTQERNGKQRLLQVAAKYSAILDKIAA
jgi:hypothetical protein